MAHSNAANNLYSRFTLELQCVCLCDCWTAGSHTRRYNMSNCVQDQRTHTQSHTHTHMDASKLSRQHFAQSPSSKCAAECWLNSKNQHISHRFGNSSAALCVWLVPSHVIHYRAILLGNFRPDQRVCQCVCAEALCVAFAADLRPQLMR